LLPELQLSRDAFVAALREGDPPIEVVLHDETSVAFSPHLLQEGEANQVEDRVLHMWRELARPRLVAAGTV
jgi:hypothetical protein